MRLAYQQRQLASGATQWLSPPIFTLSEWLSQHIEAAILVGDIDAATAPVGELTVAQEELLWEHAIQQSLRANIAAELFDTRGLASAASEAHRYLIEWNISLGQAHLSEETQQFLQWRQTFQRLCKPTGMLEAVRYQAWQITCIEQGAGRLPAQLMLAGFDRINPHLARLTQALKQRGCAVAMANLTHPTPEICVHTSLPDLDSECRAAVAWAQAMLVQQPHAKLAIVVPDLATLRHPLGQLLDDAFHPSAHHPANAEQARCYDFSLGVPLSSLAIIDTGLALLRLAWAQQALLQSELARLLHSPYWSSHRDEASARAQFEADMRQQLPRFVHPKRWVNMMQQALRGERPIAIPRLLADYLALTALSHQYRRAQPPSQWTQVFQQALNATHWPGDRALSSHEYQATQSFNKALQQLAHMDLFLGAISPYEALKRLQQLCQTQIFQTEQQAQPAIRVMGLLETSAEPLDAMWVLGMNDQVWPPPARPNALISAELQRQAKTPNASSQVQSEFALAVHERLSRSAKQVIFSSAQADGDRHLRASPLMHAIPACPLNRPFMQTLAEQQCNQALSQWQWLDDHQAPPVLANEHIAGGTSLLRAQALCPAWAFYQYRLGAKQLHTPISGLDVLERGSLVHAVLAEFWQGQDSQLLQSSTQSLTTLVQRIAGQVVAKFNVQKQGALSEAFLQLESERLTRLVMAWLVEVEKQRPQGFRVLACEQAHNLTIGNVRIKLVIDRVDALADGGLVVIDYKTGRQLDVKNWAQAQITEPQLPVYAAFVLEASEVVAVCFAKLRPTEVGFVGIAATSDLIQGAAVLDEKRGRAIFDANTFPDWPSVMHHWHRTILATAQSLTRGDAAVCVQDEQQLAYCEVLPLLRLPERWLQFEHSMKTTQSA